MWDSWALWVLVHDENGMPGSSGEHLVLMSEEGEVIPRFPASTLSYSLFFQTCTFLQQIVWQGKELLENLRTNKDPGRSSVITVTTGMFSHPS